MFEPRSGEFKGRPALPSTTGNRRRRRRRGCVFFGYFILHKQKKVTRSPQGSETTQLNRKTKPAQRQSNPMDSRLAVPRNFASLRESRFRGNDGRNRGNDGISLGKDRSRRRE